jgi:hypothetical protein
MSGIFSLTQRVRPIAEYANARCAGVWQESPNARQRTPFQAMDHGCRSLFLVAEAVHFLRHAESSALAVPDGSLFR